MEGTVCVSTGGENYLRVQTNQEELCGATKAFCWFFKVKLSSTNNALNIADRVHKIGEATARC